jgi:hypothetical protein
MFGVYPTASPLSIQNACISNALTNKEISFVLVVVVLILQRLESSEESGQHEADYQTAEATTHIGGKAGAGTCVGRDD